jgi:hypothetical protein
VSVLLGVPPGVGVFEGVTTGLGVRVSVPVSVPVRVPVVEPDDPGECVGVTRAVRVVVAEADAMPLRDRVDVSVAVRLKVFAALRVAVLVGLSKARDRVAVVVGDATARDRVAVPLTVPARRDRVAVCVRLGLRVALARVAVALLVNTVAGLGVRPPNCPVIGSNISNNDISLICVYNTKSA